jgi:hypothetical protein
MNDQKQWEQREATFSLRRNPNRAKNEKAPDVTGLLCIEGKMYEISGWNKIAASGAHWMSGTVKPQQAKPTPRPKQDDSDIPW